MSNRELWTLIAELLTLKQYTATMGGDMTYKSKAERAMRVSKSKRVHELCKLILQSYEESI